MDVQVQLSCIHLCGVKEPEHVFATINYAEGIFNNSC
jgi:hypothetical protein